MRLWYNVFFKKCVNICLLITIISIPFILVAGCHSLSHVSKSETLDNLASWSLHNILQWFSEKRGALKQITAWVKVVTANNGEKGEGFDALISLDNKGRGRIEGLGPWRSPLFCLVFDPNSVYFYLSNESRLYLSQNHPAHIRKLIGLPLDLSCLFDIMTSNLPESLSLCPQTASPKGKFHELCLKGEAHGADCEARVVIKDFPVVEELFCSGVRVPEEVRVRYVDTLIVDGYTFPKDIYLNLSGGSEWDIRFRSIKLNQPALHPIFIPDDSWFLGDVFIVDDPGS